MSSTTETPSETPDAGPRKGAAADALTLKLLIGLVVVLGVVALLVSGTKGSSSSAVEPLGPSTPTRVSVPSISVSSSLVGLGLDRAGELAVPPLSTPMQASWFDQGPTPGSVGPAVVLGHINGGGKPGVFANLDKVQAGAEISVDRADGQTAVYTVSHVDTVPKNAFPTDAVYGDTAGSELRLITCGGDLDRAARSYRDNVIVFAELTATRPT